MVVEADELATRESPRGDGSLSRRRARWPAASALLCGLLSVVSALALPFAPVSVNQPEVSWPTDPTAPTSTMLMLTAYRPLALDATFSCRLAEAAGSTPGSTVVATTRPDSPPGVAAGLLVSSADGVLTVTSRGDPVARDPIGPGPCRYRIAGEGDTVVFTRDGSELGRGPMPDVDALTTSVSRIPGASPADLSVRVTVDDRFSTSPTPAKLALLAILAVSTCVAVGLLVVADRRVRGPTERRARSAPKRSRSGRLLAAAVDAAVVVILVAWLFLAPLTPDDSYYSAMATNAPLEGYVGNYYQVFNQGFTPFTWIYQVLAWWQQIVGLSPVALRIPALVCGLLTWVCARRLVLVRGRDRSGALASPGSRRGVLTTAAVAVAFLAWWMPFDLGVRPEPVIALATTASLLCVVLAAERGSLVLAGAAVGLSSLGATASPTGLVALAPLIAGLPGLWPTLKGDGGRLAATARILCVVAPGAVGAVAAFGDGSWRDFVHAQQLLYGVQTFENWYTEYKRWESLLDAGSSSYAVRAAVLVTVLALLGFVVLWAAAKARSRPLPRRLVVSAATVALAFVLLAPSPSKPWMHFGAIAGVGGVFLALMVVEAPRAVRDLAGGRRLPRAAVLTAVVAVVLTLALAGHGVNTWWLSTWSPDMPHAGTPPQVWIFRFDQPLWWLLGVIAVALLVIVVTGRHDQKWKPYAAVVALSAVVAVFLASNVVYLLGTFGLEAARTADSWSIPGENLRDPFATQCAAGSQVQAADPAGPPLNPDPRAPSAPPSRGFAPGGWVGSDPPPLPPLPPPAATGWGSLTADPASPDTLPDERTGTLTTPWLTIPAAGPDQAVTSLVSGRTGDGSSLTVEYGRLSPGGVDVVGSRLLGGAADPTQSVSSDAWRSVDLASRESVPPPGSDVLRLVAVDDRTDIGGWIAFTAPRLSRFVPIDAVVARGAPTALSWPVALLFPCIRQPRIQNGITEPAVWAVGYANGPLEFLRDGTWQTGRGGVFGQAGREADVTQLVSRFRTDPGIRPVQVYRLQEPYERDAYTLVPGRRVVAGWDSG